jgi:hypothetical protein
MTAAAIAATPKLAPSCYIIKGGQKIGVVGVTTPILAAISSPGTTTVKNPGAGTENMALLATIIQPYIDSLRNQEGIEKIILLAHLQQLSNEKALAVLLNGVDIIVAGGSNTLMADATDRLRAGDVAAETYYDLDFSPAAGNVVLNGNVNALNAVALVAGKVDLNGNLFTIGTTSSNGALTGGTSTEYFISGTAASKLVRYTTTPSTSYSFPVGDASNYTPMTVQLYAGPMGATSQVSVDVIPSMQPNLVGSTNGKSPS